MEKRVYNFSPGPAVLPLPVLQEAQRDLLALPGTGISILEISHRSKAFDKIINQAEANLRTLLGIPDNYRVLFLQGGAILQFGMVAMNLLRGTGKSANYIVNGTWSKKASRGGQDPGPGPRRLGRQARQLQPRPQAERVEARPQRRLRLHLLERDDPGRAVPQGARGGRPAADLRLLVRLPLPAGADREVRHPLRLRPEERRARRA